MRASPGHQDGAGASGWSPSMDARSTGPGQDPPVVPVPFRQAEVVSVGGRQGELPVRLLWEKQLGDTAVQEGGRRKGVHRSQMPVFPEPRGEISGDEQPHPAPRGEDMVPGGRPRGGVEGQGAGRGIGRPAVHQGGTGHVRSSVQVPYGVHDAEPARGEGEAESGDEVIGLGIGHAFPSEAMQQGGGRLPGSGLRPFEGIDDQFDLDGISEGRIEPLAQVEQLVGGEPDEEGGRIGPVPVPGQLGMVRQGLPLVGLLCIGTEPFRCRAPS